MLITVDNGIASVEGVAEANRLGMQVLVTDHHLPGDQLPDAWCIINPNQPGCDFPEQEPRRRRRDVLPDAGAARRTAQTRRLTPASPAVNPISAHLLDLVALGTVADVVRLDDNNRMLVQQGLQRIRAGRAQPGIAALLSVAGRDPRARRRPTTWASSLGPRLNAAGRLTDMSLGIECLITDDPVRAHGHRRANSTG